MKERVRRSALIKRFGNGESPFQCFFGISFWSIYLKYSRIERLVHVTNGERITDLNGYLQGWYRENPRPFWDKRIFLYPILNKKNNV